MELLKAAFLITLICVTIAADDKNVVPTGPQVTSSTEKQPTTTTTTTTSSTTAPSTTTKSSTTSTTTTSTQKPTTKSSTTSTTTTSTTTAKPTTSPSPKPVDPTGKWVANYTGTNRTCIVLAACLDIDIYYKNGNNSNNFTVHVPPTAVANGQCGNNSDVETITLTWNTVDSVKFNFKQNTDKKYELESVNTFLNVILPGENDTVILAMSHNKSEFSTPLTNSYKCVEAQKLNLTSQSKGLNFTSILRVSHFQMQAFRNSTSVKFDEALDCASSETPDVVPIAVGCALAALVIIVLIAYLIGRRRSQARGYLSM